MSTFTQLDSSGKPEARNRGREVRSKRRLGPAVAACQLLLGLAVGFLPLVARAETYSVASPWPADSAWVPYTYGGSSLRDPEGGKTDDKTNGGASFSAESDIASGWTGANQPCNPSAAGVQCGTQNSVYWYVDNKTPGSNTDGVLFMRMRVGATPSDGGRAFSASNWNFLISITGTVNTPIGAPPGSPTRTYLEDITGAQDAKEFWVDVYGGAQAGNNSVDRVDLFYANNPTNELTGGGNSPREPDSIPGCNETTAGRHLINSFLACNGAGVTGCMSGGNDRSHTRIVPTVNGEYFVDVQVPFSALTDSCGTYSLNGDGLTVAITRGNQLVFDDGQTNLEIAYSTSDSGPDPLQKDYIGDCVGAACFIIYGAPVSTPVTLSSFRATAQGSGATFEWSTATEVGNVGFNLYNKVDDEWVKVNESLIASHVVNSLTREDYSYSAERVTGRDFWIEEVDVRGKTQLHGPFALGERYGDDSKPEAIAWGAIRSQHATARAEVQKRRLASWRQREYPRVDFRVSQKGIYRVTHEDLLAAGVDLARVPENKLALVNRGRPMPIYVNAKGTFGAGSWIEFYGEPSNSIYTDVNVYQLQVDGSKALRLGDDPKPPRRGVAPEASYQETATWDENRDYAFLSPNGDPWYRTMLCAYPGGASCGASMPASATISVPVDQYVPGGGPVALSVDIWGLTARDHHVTVSLNGSQVGDSFFSGTTARTVRADVDSSLLASGNPQLTVRLPGDANAAPWEMVGLDRYSITYPRAFAARQDLLVFDSAGKQFEVGGLSANGAVVHRLESNGQWVRLREIVVAKSGAGYSASFAGTGKTAHYVVSGSAGVRKPEIGVAPSDLTLASDPAQFLVIAHPDFIAGLDGFVQGRKDRYQVKVADLEAVYHQFGDGTVDPAAIQSYIRHAVARLGTEYVLLVGGDSFDYKNYLGLGSMSFIPSLYVATDELVRFAPSDPALADVDGDGVPDVPIGRLPVRSGAELAVLLEKTEQYGRRTYDATAVISADLGFGGDAEAFVDALPGPWTVERGYLDRMSAASAKALIKSSINRGAALTGFVGHSGPTVWTYRGLFSAADALSLTNAGRPTLVSQWGCWNSYYVEPRYNTMAHALLVAGNKGAAAVLGTTTVSSDVSERQLGTALIPFLTQPGTTIGAALQMAKRQVAAENPAAADVLLGWTILGDPTLVITP